MSRTVNFNHYKKQINNNAWYQAQYALKIVKNMQAYDIVTYHPFTINNKDWLNGIKNLGKFDIFSLSKTKFWPKHPAFSWIANGRILIVGWKDYQDGEELWALIAKSNVFACSINGFFFNLNKYQVKKINSIKKQEKSIALLPIAQQFAQIINTNVFILHNIIINLMQVLLKIKNK